MGIVWVEYTQSAADGCRLKRQAIDVDITPR